MIFKITKQLLTMGLVTLSLMTHSVAEPLDFVAAGSAAPWVITTNLIKHAEQSLDDVSEGMHYLFFDQQVNEQTDEYYLRNVMLLKNETGVQNAGKLAIAIDPSYQTIKYHAIKVIRGGQEIDKLDLSSIKLIQPETSLGSHMFTGIRQAVLFVEDLRVGDILDYQYTLKGRHPSFKNHYAEIFALQWQAPLEYQRIRLLWPKLNQLFVQNKKTDLKPVVTDREELLEYTWEIRNAEPVSGEDMTPYGFEPYAYVELSNYKDWSEVINWALPLYRAETSDLPDDLAQIVNRIVDEHQSLEQRILAALHFVQDEIRYTGIELGRQAFEPAHPYETFRLRYGDCKGKSVLLCRMLQEMGVSAYPALVSTRLREGVSTRLPSPTVFNHVIVKVDFDGGSFWVDPIIPFQGGGLRRRYITPYKKALVIKEGVEGLETIVPQQHDSMRTIKSVFDASVFGEPCQLDVETIATGLDADNIRSYIAGSGRTELDQNLLNYIVCYYPSARANGSFEYEDDRDNNRLVLRESYTLARFWSHDDELQQWSASFYADSLGDILSSPQVRVRKMPLFLCYPVKRQQTLAIRLPDMQWTITPETQRIDDFGFSLDYSQQLVGNELTVTYEYESKTNSIPAKKVGSFLGKRVEFQKLVSRSLYKSSIEELAGGAVNVNWLMVFLSVFGLGSSISLCLKIWAIKGAVDKPEQVDEYTLFNHVPSGIRGWLVLVALGLCLTPVLFLVQFLKMSDTYFSSYLWQTLTVSTSGQYIPLYGLLLIFELLGNILITCVSVLLLALFFAKRSIFPAVYISTRIGVVVFLLADSVLAAWVLKKTEYDPGLLRSIISAAIWCTYMVRSKRVKATFVK